MALGKITGPMLVDNLVRNGLDLTVETDLLYIDVNNNRIGINTDAPGYALSVTGTIDSTQLRSTQLTVTSPDTFTSLQVNNSGVLITGTLSAPSLALTTALPIVSGGTGATSAADALTALGAVALASKDAENGYAGLTLHKINFKNAANTFTSFFTNTNTIARTYTFQDRDSTIADNTDLAAKVSKTGDTMTGNLQVPSSSSLLVTTELLPAIRPSLQMNFAQGQRLDPRLTFTRASTATRTNASGLIEAIASGQPRFDFDPITLACKGLLIEEQRTNLLTYSSDFANAAWFKSNTAVTANAATAPDGTMTADRLVENATTSAHTLQQAVTSLFAGVYTVSFYVKAGERAKFQLGTWDGITGQDVVFDLAAGSISSGTGGAIQAASNGFYRCSVTRSVASVTLAIYAYIYASAASYTGDGASGLYIWGAQLEAGSFATSYMPSADTFTSRESTATFIGSTGLIETAAINTARMQYNPLNLTVPPVLLLEAEGTNLLTYSEQFDNAAWSDNYGCVTVASNVATAPDGTTTVDGLTRVGPSVTWCSIGQPVAVGAGGNVGKTYTFSLWAWLASGTATVSLSISDRSYATYAAAASTLTTTPTRLTFTTSGGAGWNALGDYIGAGFQNLPLGVQVLVWGAQLEAGTSATSYIPTTGSTATRAADVSSSAQTTRAADACYTTQLAPWFNASEGTMVVEADQASAGDLATQYCVAELGDGTNNNLLQIATQYGLSNFQALISSGGVTQADFLQASSTALTKRALAYAANNFGSAVGGVASSDAVGSVPAITKLGIGMRPGNVGQLNGHIASFKFYPQRLPNTTLQALTS